MKRILPCRPMANKRGCADGIAKLRDKNGLQPYDMGNSPAAFGTTGARFAYQCMACKQRTEISRREFFALPDLDLKPSAPAESPAAATSEAGQLRMGD